MLKRKSIPPSSELKELFDYHDGNLYHKHTRTGVYAGQRAGNFNIKYPVVKINGSAFKLHRVVFMMHHGYCPECLDHINGNPHDNRIENLRPATISENYANKSLYKTSKSGVKGVYWHTQTNQWLGYVQFQKRRVYVGAFATLELAKECIELVREMMHGEFANHGVNT